MKIFIDSGDPDEVKKYLVWGICDGVTTNPTIMRKCGVSGEVAMLERQIELAELIAPRPLSVEVTTDNPKEILQQARYFKDRLPGNIMVKVTITDREGNGLLPAIHELASDGIVLNVTAMTTLNQCMLATKALVNGSLANSKVEPLFLHAISIFGGRISEERGSADAARDIRQLREWLDKHQFPVEIIVGSVRSRENLTDWALTGAHILTVPPDVLRGALTAGRTTETVVQFLEDARQALGV